MGVNRIPPLPGPFGVRRPFKRRIPFDPLAAPWDTFFDPRTDYYSDNGSTLATAGATVQLGKNQMNAGASLNLSQASSGLRMTYRVGANGVGWLESSGGYYESLLIPCTAGLVTAHLVKWDQNGYYNLWEDTSAAYRIWIDSSGRIEPSGASSVSGYNDGNWHVVMLFIGPTGSSRVTLWVDGVQIQTSTPFGIGTNKTINLFNRGSGTGWKGGVGYFAFGSFNPTTFSATYPADLATWMLANKPT
jgi:hypothetical protein